MPGGPLVTGDGLDYSAADDPLVTSFVEQLEELDLLDDQRVLGWKQLYRVLRDPDFGASPRCLPVPPIDASIVPALGSTGSLTDADLNVSIRRWHRLGGGMVADAVETTGAIITGGLTEPVLMGEEVFDLLQEMKAFQRRPRELRGPQENRLAWASLRQRAIAADAVLDMFLRDTIVLRPEMLDLQFERGGGADSAIVKITPTFEGAPELWLRHFDRSRLKDTYRLAEPGGSYVEVVIDAEVAPVLRTIKELPGRTLMGPRAAALLDNPIAFFGEHSGVLDVGHIEEALREVRDGTYRFSPKADIDQDGGITNLAMIVEPEGETVGSTEVRVFTTPEGALAFIAAARSAESSGLRFFGWSGFDLTLDDRALEDVGRLQRLVDRWSAGSADASAVGDAPAARWLIEADLVLDLRRYFERIDGIGLETPYGIIKVPLNKSGAWLPEESSLTVQVPVGDGHVEVPLTRDDLAGLRSAVATAREDGAPSVRFASGTSLPLEVAKEVLAVMPAELTSSAATKPTADVSSPNGERRPRIGLLIKPNIDTEDFVTTREQDLRVPEGAVALLPRSLREDVTLKDHQRFGVLWLQHLLTQAPHRCRGALLADDMGLGKTLQILTVIARAREDDPDLAPALVVAPVTLLENWEAEVERFFEPDAIPVTTLYAEALRAQRVKTADIDARLREEGLRRFLRPGWHEGAGIVLTTYETLRDYEFSFAEVQWSVVACDEAQRIKNPNALVTRAAKKLRARLCVAVTGTPVENNLTDLWSLFDFIQPGLLEPLNVFNKRYRRPIEAQTDEEKDRVEDLRRLIDPQVLRRTKADVIKDLPEKIFDEACRALAMTPKQRLVYQSVVEGQRMLSDDQRQAGQLLATISELRRVCTDPRSAAELTADPPPLAEYVDSASKMRWLLATLEHIRTLDEKAIIFLERKDIQRLVQLYTRERFGSAPEIINGDTPAGRGHDSRQRRVDRFQRRPGFAALILSPVAAGVGLNIQEANHVIHYMRHWNPAKEDQATDRAYRIGQTRDVIVYTPTVVGSGFVSFDERLDELLEKKRGIAANMLNGADDVTADDFAGLVSA